MKKTKINLKQILSIAVTVLVIIVLFGIIFVKLDIVEPTPTFFLELSAIISLIIVVKLNWYNWAQDKRIKEDDIIKATSEYDSYADKEITDIYDFEKFLKTLNKENRENYVKNKLKNRTKDNYPKYKELCDKYEKEAIRRVPEIKSCDVKTRGSSLYLIDSKNHLKEKKYTYQVISTVWTIVWTTIMACIAFKEMMMCWANVFRYASYLCTIAMTMYSTISEAYKTTEEETLDHLTRLQFIIDKYVNYKEGKEDVIV